MLWVLTLCLRIVWPHWLVLLNLQCLHIGSDSVIVVEHTDTTTQLKVPQVLLGLTRQREASSLPAGLRRTRRDTELATKEMKNVAQDMEQDKLLDGAWPIPQAVKIRTSRNPLVACIRTGLACEQNAAVAERGGCKLMPTAGKRTLLTRAWPVC